MRPLLLGLVLASSGLAHAAPADDASKAETLFADGQKLKEAGKPAEACAKFDEALHFNRNAVGTILNVALCDEQAGKVASAAKLFVEARDRAREQNLGEHRKAAEDHLSRIEATVPHIAIAFAEAPGRDTNLVIDNVFVDLTTAGDIAIDPGTRTITLTAPGRVPYETKIEIALNEHKAIAIPKLAYPVTVKKARHTVGIVIASIGAAGIITSEILALKARSDYRGAIAGCPNLMCDTGSYTRTHDAYTLGNIATGIGIAGAVAMGAGAFLWLFAPVEQQRTGVSVVPSIGPDHAGFAAVGRF